MLTFDPVAEGYWRQPIPWKILQKKAKIRARRKRGNWQFFFETMNPRRNHTRYNDPQYDTKAELGLLPELFPGYFSNEQITLLHQRAYRAEMDLSPLSSEAEEEKDERQPEPRTEGPYL
uniref:Uncharacterized protein n=1 Tax=Chromera velia CCMP2878 TaxID=1169474 RepID=A0A0G4HBQ1_9ALVE|eukprot:Cvel_6158.t1-p1 / transcript=Cvel_6158.t1 / gene=Cvel_6158 / organism=Chromera_velia_CCMP2878 / gene_product=hypothetical protein / transcript_product=hypothetical protein / location=Cvel_scaffold298:451-1245(+) / protein_length=118 / sequence_SO=supercontig / SO=protein_coding / is_pseudo=false